MDGCFPNSIGRQSTFSNIWINKLKVCDWIHRHISSTSTAPTSQHETSGIRACIACSLSELVYCTSRTVASKSNEGGQPNVHDTSNSKIYFVLSPSGSCLSIGILGQCSIAAKKLSWKHSICMLWLKPPTLLDRVLSTRYHGWTATVREISNHLLFEQCSNQAMWPFFYNPRCVYDIITTILTSILSKINQVYGQLLPVSIR